MVWCAVWCGTLKTPCVDSKTPPCVDSKRPRVCRQHAHMLFSMCAWCRHTRGRFESTHGGVFESTRVVVASSVYQKNHARRVITWPHRFTESNHWMLPMFKFEKRSRTTCSRFLQSFALPNKAVKLQLSWRNIGRTSREMVRFVFRSHEKVERTICALVSLEASTRVSPDFAHHHHHHHTYTCPCPDTDTRDTHETHGHTRHTLHTRDTHETHETETHETRRHTHTDRHRDSHSHSHMPTSNSNSHMPTATATATGHSNTHQQQPQPQQQQQQQQHPQPQPHTQTQTERQPQPHTHSHTDTQTHRHTDTDMR